MSTNIGNKKFTNEEIKKIARTYIFRKNMTYKKLAEMYGCSDSTISYMMNYELQNISKCLLKLVKKKAERNKKKSRKQFAMKKK